MASTSEYWVGDAIGEGSFGVVVYGRYKHADSGQGNGHIHVAIKCVDKNSLKKQPSLAMAVIQEQRLLKRLKERPQFEVTTTTSRQQNDHRRDNASTNTATSTKNENSNNNFIVDLYASFHDRECVYLVLECCCGGTLQDLLDHYISTLNMREANVLPKVSPSTVNDDVSTKTNVSTKLLESTQYYGIQLLTGISFIHSRSIIHCDIKPSNVLLTDIGRIKISDFGSSIDLTKNNAIEQKRPDANEINSSTASGVTTNSISRMMTIPLGTAAYAAPELNRQQYQSLDRPHDKNGGNDATDVHTAPTAAVDLWSLGCVLYACLMEDSFHQSPFDKGSEAASLEAQKDYCDIMDTSKRYDVLFGKNPINLPDITESKNDISAKNRESLQELKHLIAELLNPIAEERIKFARQKPEIQTVPSKSLASLPLQKDISSVSNEEVNHLMMYPHLQCNVVWGVTDITHLQLTTDFLPPTPSWWIKYSSAHTPTTSTTTTTSQDSSDTSTNILVDGAIGWSAFLV